MDPVLGGVVVELQQHIEVVGDLRGGLGPLHAVVGLNALTAFTARSRVLGVVDLGECCPGARLGGLGQAVQYVRR